MEMEMKDELQAQIERLAAAAETLERLVSQHSVLAADGEASIGRIVAMVGATAESRREAELVQRLEAAEKTIAELRASVASMPYSVTHQSRRTLPMSLLAKQEGTIGSLDSGALDAALVSLSLEQRIAVKAQLLRAGLV
jgi:acetolactate synthase small subunit